MKIDFDLDTKESIRTFVRQELWNIINEGMWHERHRVEEASSNQSTSHDHVPVPPDVLESRRRVAREGGGLRLHDGSRNVHPGGCESEHRMLDGGASRTEIHVENQDPETNGAVLPNLVPDVEAAEMAQRILLGTNWYSKNKDTPEDHTVTFNIAAPIDAWAALVLEHEYEGFSTGNRGRAAQQLYETIALRLTYAYPDWRAAWDAKSSR